MVNSFANDFEYSNKIYYNDLRSYKSLNKKEEKKLFSLYKDSNDINARNKIITSNLKFVVDIAKKYKGHGLSFADLVSEGNLGLIKSIDKFDDKKDVKIISYGVWWIRQSIVEAINKKKMIPSNELPDDKNNINVNELSLNSDIDDDDDEVIDNRFIEEEKSYNEEDKIKLIDNLLTKLTKRESSIITLYFGLNNNDEMTLDEIGKKLNLSKERVRQIKENALKKLRSNVLLIKNQYLINR